MRYSIAFEVLVELVDECVVHILQNLDVRRVVFASHRQRKLTDFQGIHQLRRLRANLSSQICVVVGVTVYMDTNKNI
jgi:hypothetical protein